jgi:CheY-like chemotaxis protein
MSDKVLFVDDEPAFLQGYQIMLRSEFEVETAVGGEQGLAAVRDRGPFAVVVSDMRMPGMNGAEFLARVRQTAPDTVRMMLTAHTDINTAMDAVNQGNIFRFLAKPCEREVLAKAIAGGLVQYRLVTAEKELLEKTLLGSIKVLTEVLSAVSPEAFGRSVRITGCVHHLAARFHLPSPWVFEAAAMLSQLGCIALDPEMIQAAYAGTHLSPEDQAQFAAHPQVARELLAHIPRLEPVAWMIGQQLTKEIPQQAPPVPALPMDVLVLGAKMLKLAVTFDNLKMRGLSHEDTINQLRHTSAGFEPELVDALADMKAEKTKMELRKVPISTLTTGMILQQDVRTRFGLLVVAKGQEVSHPLLARLQNFSRARLIDHEILASVPV